MILTQSFLMDALIPGAAKCHECPPQPAHPLLHQLEEVQLAGSSMSDKRRREFSLGRWCARQAMAAFDSSQVPLLIGPSRAPIWPQGITGSITHCEDYCAAAIADTKDVITIGIDAEPWDKMSYEIQAHIATEEEYAHSDLDRSDPSALTLLFSAKESIYKALSPLTGLFFDFLSVKIVVDTKINQFFITSTTVSEILTYRSCLIGRFLITDRLVLTSAYIMR